MLEQQRQLKNKIRLTNIAKCIHLLRSYGSEMIRYHNYQNICINLKTQRIYIKQI